MTRHAINICFRNANLQRSDALIPYSLVTRRRQGFRNGSAVLD